ncbi:MAG: zf-HC2 domain-containing protein [Pyrinomonadaceae bacterium]
MKQEFDQEMDSLLRAHARRAGHARAAAMQGAQADAHLDADELSAYAEGALPAPTRTRYTAHLADCDTCRREVALLAGAAGVADRLAQQPAIIDESVPVLSWRARLAALFAPGPWRYALPVVALFAVSSVVFLVTRGTREAPQSVATQIASAPRANQAPEQNHALAEQPTFNDDKATGVLTDSADTNTTNSTVAVNKPVASPTTATTDAPHELLARNEAQAGQVAAPPVVAPPPKPEQSSDTIAPVNQVELSNQNVAANQNAGVGLNSSQIAQQQPAPTTRGYAPEPPVGDIALAKPQAKKEEAKTEKPKGGAVADQPRESERAADKVAASGERGGPRKARETTRAKDRDEAALHGPARSMNAPRDDRATTDRRASEAEETAATARRRPDTESSRGAGGADASERRSVAGRQFRRQKNAWVDTAYRAGQATVQIRRDSEQWRALVADEPDLRRIADALGGEVIVVWHGRTYRIKQ